MKKIILLISLSVFLIDSVAQIYYSTGPTVYTCNGGAVATLVPNREMSDNEMSSIIDALISPNGQFYYLGITSSDIISGPSSTYNCHSYAWHLSEGNSEIVWINNPTAYWTSTYGCFLENTEDYAVKIHYYDGDHSAIKSNVSGKYESKWGQFPLIRHYPNQVPYSYPSHRHYYYKPIITGPSMLCFSGGSFSIPNVPAGASITWSSSAGIARTSAQGSNPCTFIATNSGTTGWIGSSITYNGTTIQSKIKSTWLGGVPSPELYANNATLSGWDYYTVELNASDVFFYLAPDPAGFPIYPDTWDVEGDSYWYTNGSFLEFFPNTVGENIVAGYRHNACGFNGTYFFIEVVNSKSGEGTEDVSFKLNPNPTKEFVDITLSIPEEEKQDDNYQVDFVNAYSRIVKQVKLNGTYNRINIQDLVPGYFVVMLRYNGKVYSNKLIIE